MVPKDRRAAFEFLSTSGDGSNLTADIGAAEAQSVLQALNLSRLIRQQAHGLLFAVSGRYFVHDFEARVQAACRRASDAVIVLQNPEWPVRRQETSVIGFTLASAHLIYSWAIKDPPQQQYCLECHVTELVRRVRLHHSHHICDLPPLRVDRVREGSTGILRSSI